MKIFLMLIIIICTNNSFATTYYVSTNGDNTNSGKSRNKALESIQEALNKALPGDYVKILPGVYLEHVITKISGKKNNPIKIIGSKERVDFKDHGLEAKEILSPVIIRGEIDSVNKIFQIRHSYIEVHDLTIDGLIGNPIKKNNYIDKLMYVNNPDNINGLTGINIKRIVFKNAGGECLRLRNFITNSRVSYSTFNNCGVHDFVFHDGKKNGEAIYIGTSFRQWGNNNPDESANNLIHHNMINTSGNECIDLKEGTRNNKIYNNICTGQLDGKSAGFSSKGIGNIFKNNTVFGNAGSGFYFGSAKDGYGIDNIAINNHVYSNTFFGFNIIDNPQGKICGNNVIYNKLGPVNRINEYDPTQPCE